MIPRLADIAEVVNYSRNDTRARINGGTRGRRKNEKERKDSQKHVSFAVSSFRDRHVRSYCVLTTKTRRDMGFSWWEIKLENKIASLRGIKYKKRNMFHEKLGVERAWGVDGEGVTGEKETLKLKLYRVAISKKHQSFFYKEPNTRSRFRFSFLMQWWTVEIHSRERNQVSVFTAKTIKV